MGRALLDGTVVQPHYIDTGASSYPLAIAIDNGTLYPTELGQIVRVPVTNATPPQLVVALPANFLTFSMAVAGGYIYVGGFDDTKQEPSGAILRVQLNGSGLDPSFVSNLYEPTGVAVDADHVYWVDHSAPTSAIGRARLTSGEATDVQPDFVTEPGGPIGIAVDSGIDPTATSIACSPSTVAKGSPTTCTVTVHDAASSAPPTGTVNFTGDATTFFQGNPCQLTPLAGGGGSSCVVGADPTNAGTETITASYGGDAVHQASSGTLSLCVGAGSACGAIAPPPAKPKCVVPKLKGRSLLSAERRLAAAHCKLGKVTRPRHKRRHTPGKLIVGSQRPAAGTQLANGAKVALKLVRAPKRRHHR